MQRTLNIIIILLLLHLLHQLTYIFIQMIFKSPSCCLFNLKINSNKQTNKKQFLITQFRDRLGKTVFNYKKLRFIQNHEKSKLRDF